MAVSATRSPVTPQPPLPKPTPAPGKPPPTPANQSSALASLSSLLGGSEAKPASTAKNGIAVVDFFETLPGQAAPHGDDVNHVVNQTSQSSAPVVEVPLPVEAKPDQGLEGRIENRVAGLLEASSSAIEGILSNPGQTKVINQSLETSPARIIHELSVELAQENLGLAEQGLEPGSGPKATQLRKELGFPEGEKADDQEVLQALVDRVEATFENSPRIAAARQRYEEQTQKLEEAGILNVVAAGNEGEVVAQLKQAGVTFGENFSQSVLANDTAITVGSTDGNKLASFSLPSNQVDVVVNGKNVPVGDGRLNEGTSFSAPQVAATLADMFAANPNLTNDQARAILYQSAQDTALTPQEEGHGVLDMDQARRLAALSALGLQVPSA